MKETCEYCEYYMYAKLEKSVVYICTSDNKAKLIISELDTCENFKEAKSYDSKRDN